MAIDKEITSPRKGMNRDSHPSELKGQEYSFLLNGNIQNENGNGRLIIQNEPSNVKCSGFKSGYKVVGHAYDMQSQEVFFLLTNPTTGISELGVISSIGSAEINIPTEQTNGGVIQVVLETPLEERPQISSCSYTTLLDDSCESNLRCLNLSVDYPIHENNIHIKHGKNGRTLWFTDGPRNPQRYIEIDNIQKYYERVDPCTDEVVSTCLDCEAMRIFPLFDKPCLEPEVIQNGGNLPAGIIEAVVCYSNLNGDNLTSFYSLTNPTPIQDPNNNILDQTNLDYITNQALKISVFGLDKNYEFYKVVAIYRSGLDGAQSCYEIGVYPIAQDSFTIVTLKEKTEVPFEDIVTTRPYYARAKNLTVANGYLYHSGLVGERELNLQPVVNLMGAFGRWATYQAKENLYSDGIGVANYKSALRDEVYPYGIVFEKLGGTETALFPFIARPPKDSEIAVASESDEVSSVLAYNKQCQGNDRTLVWQFQNTATDLGPCLVEGEGIEGTEVLRDVELSCYVLNEAGTPLTVATIEDSSLIVPAGSEIVSYINTHLTQIIESTGANGSDIRDILSAPEEAPGSCIPNFDDSCEKDPELIDESLFVISVGDQLIEEVSITTEEYKDQYGLSTPNASCNILETNTSGPIEDTVFETSYMDSGEVVYKRLTVGNGTCSVAIAPPLLVSPQIDNSNHFLAKGQIGAISTLIQSKSVSQTRFKGDVFLAGSSGSANIIIDGVPYLATYSTSLAVTATNFVTTHAAAILSATGLVVTVGINAINFNGDYSGFFNITVNPVSGTLDGATDFFSFTDQLHSNAIWYKVDFAGSERVVFEIGQTTCSNPDDNTFNSLRLSAFQSCVNNTDLPTYSKIIDNTDIATSENLIVLESSDFGGTSSSAYIALDTQIRTRNIKVLGVSNVLTVTCGCFSVFRREIATSFRITYSDLLFGKKQTYRAACTFVIPQLNNCEAVPYRKGLFSYVESTEIYPCNKELYDSSVLEIAPDDIPIDYKEEFEDYYTEGLSGGNYILKPETDFRDRPIRHFKYPDNTIAPFMSYAIDGEPNQDSGPFGKSIIYPIGFSISAEVINAFLDLAVKNSLISFEERSRIVGYKIFRGDRRTQRSIIAKGLLFDTYKYNESPANGGEEVLYTNYPLNSLGRDALNEVDHPFSGLRNNAFTFHSPETSFYKPSLTSEMRIEGHLYGSSANYFDEVDGHPTFVLLGSASYALATTLAYAECVFEFLLQSTDWLISGAAGAFGSGGGSVFIAAAGVIAIGVQTLIKGGEYRYRWIQTITNLGKPTNFAYYQATLGHYNLFRPNTDIAGQILRGIRSRTYLSPGRWQIADEITGIPYEFNNLDGEDSVFIHLGGYFLNNSVNYFSHDNYTLSPTNSSRRTYPDGTGKSPKIIGKAASPYAAIKDYLPAQYGSISSISWLDTGFCGSLESTSDCDAAFGGDIFITRFALKRKLPFFRTNAYGLAPLTPFKYSDYFNINPAANTSRFYVDYEVNDTAGDFIGTVLYPSNKSVYRLDSGGDDIGNFYIKLPNKFYLFSYGVPYFLVESEINCAFRYAKREKAENFYPNIQDIIEFTQEKNVSIKKPNEYFYNPVYSSVKSLVPYRLLPENYNREQYDKLNDLHNAAIYSEQDVRENSPYDVWLQYKALNFYEFSQSNGNLISLVGLESQQLLARFTNGFTIFGAIDQMRDRLTPETGNLGNGGIFAGRPVNFNITALGHAGSQHNALVRNEFGYFWGDAFRGKIFHLGPNGQDLKEISKPDDDFNASIEKWFKDNLPIKLVNQVPNLNIDNAMNGIGITMGWDARLKRVFVTKKDYTLLKPLNYLEGVGFYVGSINCEEGYTLVGDTCVKTEYLPKIQTGNEIGTIKTNSAAHGLQAPVLYSQYNANGSGLVDALSPTGFTFERLLDPFWLGAGVVLDRITSKLGRWVVGGALNVWYGGSTLVNVPTTKTYHVILAADNIFRFKIDGATILISNQSAMGPQHTINPLNYDAQIFRQVHIYPMELTQGCHIITVEGLNQSGIGMFASAIVDNTAQELRDATSYTELNFIYSTEDTENFIEDNIAFNCPEGFEPVSSDLCAECKKITITPPLITKVELGDPEYFIDCSWTVAYSPEIGSWISYYSFKPNFYIAFNDYFQTGMNVGDNSELGLWSHYSFMNSYQVFYGKRYPFTIEYPLVSKGVSSVLQYIEYWLDVRRYYNKHDSADAFGIGFNKAVVYNAYQNSGLLELVHQKDDDLYQNIDYPKHKVNSVEILQTEINHKWSFNFLYNRVINEKSMLPIWRYDCQQIEKTLDDRLLDYQYQYTDYLRGDYFLVRLTNDKESRFKFLFRFASNERDFYEQ